MRKSVTLALTLLGLFDSLYLFYTYTSPARPMVCIGSGCDAVRASAYSTLWDVSMPVFGVLGYTLLALVIIAESVLAARLARAARYAFLGMTGFGFLFSLYLEYLQIFMIHASCAWCVTSGAVMTALFTLAIVNLVHAGPEPEPARNLFAVCAAGVLAGVPAFYLLARHGEAAPSAPQAAPTKLAAQLVRPGSHETGNPEARLTVVEFGDFECPACGRGEAAAREVRTRYARQIRFVFRQFPLESIHFFAERAAEASECAGEQGKFWEMVDAIYSRRYDLSIEGLKRTAGEIGVDQSRFYRCLAGEAMADRVRRDIQDGLALGVRATPTFFIGQQKVEGVMTTEQFSRLVAAQLAKIGVNPAGDAAPATKAAAAPRKAVAENALPSASPGAASGGFVPGLQAAASGGFPGGFGSAGATCSDADAAKKQPALIETRELRQLLAGNTSLLFVDVRPIADYAAGRIPGAISLPADEIDRRWNSLPKDRTIVIYESGLSSGDICAAGRRVGRALLEHGFPFSQIKVYQDGLAGWKRAEPRLADDPPAGP